MCLSLSATVILSCLFLPKLRVVLLKPDKNVRSKSKITMKSTISNNINYKDSTIKVASPVVSERAIINHMKSIDLKTDPSTLKKDIELSTSPLISEEKSVGQISAKSQGSFVNSLTSSSNTALIRKDSLLPRTNNFNKPNDLNLDTKANKLNEFIKESPQSSIRKESFGKKSSLELAEPKEMLKLQQKTEQTDLESSLFSSLNQGSLTENSEPENNSEKKILLFRRSKQQTDTSETSRESSPENYEYLITLRKVPSSSKTSFSQARDSTKLRKSASTIRSPSPKSLNEINLDDDLFNETMIRSVVEQCFEELSRNKQISGKHLCVKGKGLDYYIS